jgi:hypothetical protein
MKCKERLYLTADSKKLVPEGHKDAALLYAVPGDEIPETAVELFKLVDGGLKPKAAAKGGENKESPPAGDKEAKPGEDKGPAAADEGAGAQ